MVIVKSTFGAQDYDLSGIWKVKGGLASVDECELA